MTKANAKPKTARKAPAAARAKKARVAKKPAKKDQPERSRAAKAARAGAPAKARPKTKIRPETKQAILIAQLRRKEGATLADLIKATGWQAHSVRGAISGALKKKLGLAVISEMHEGRGRVYRIVGGR